MIFPRGRQDLVTDLPLGAPEGVEASRIERGRPQRLAGREDDDGKIKGQVAAAGEDTAVKFHHPDKTPTRGSRKSRKGRRQGSRC